MYSALKHEGKSLYEYARAGVKIERKARSVHINKLVIKALDHDVAQITVACSKGTYIRTLAEDIGVVLGCGAHLIGLRRTETAAYLIINAVTIEQLEAMTIEAREALLMPVDSAVDYLPKLILNNDAAFFIMQGQSIWQSGIIPNSDLRLYDEQNNFIGLGFLQDDGKIAPRRLVQKTQ